MANSLSQKYLRVPASSNADVTDGTESAASETVDEMGCLRPVFVCIGLYYCSAIDEFGEMEGGFSESVTDGTGRTWRLVSTELVDWMAGLIVKAFGSDTVNDADLGSAILKFYRVRDRLEQEMADSMWQAPAADGSKAGTHRPGGGTGEAAAAVAA